MFPSNPMATIYKQKKNALFNTLFGVLQKFNEPKLSQPFSSGAITKEHHLICIY